MTSEEFVADIQIHAVDGMVASIDRTFRETALGSASDPHWRDALAFFARLNDHDQKIVLAIVRHASSSTASRILGYLDGEAADGFARTMLLSSSDGAKLNGDLQTDFLIQEERLSRRTVSGSAGSGSGLKYKPPPPNLR